MKLRDQNPQQYVERDRNDSFRAGSRRTDKPGWDMVFVFAACVIALLGATFVLGSNTSKYRSQLEASQADLSWMKMRFQEVLRNRAATKFEGLRIEFDDELKDKITLKFEGLCISDGQLNVVSDGHVEVANCHFDGHSSDAPAVQLGSSSATVRDSSFIPIWEH